MTAPLPMSAHIMADMLRRYANSLVQTGAPDPQALHETLTHLSQAAEGIQRYLEGCPDTLLPDRAREDFVVRPGERGVDLDAQALSVRGELQRAALMAAELSARLANAVYHLDSLSPIEKT